MYYDRDQFGSFDGPDNRRELMILMQRLGDRLPDAQARERRASFLRRIVKMSGNGFADKAVKITPCDAVQAYWILVNVCGCLSVDINAAAKLLDETVKRQ